MAGPLTGKVAVVTGASRGIGKQTALLLAGRGAELVLAARTIDPRPNTPGTLTETVQAVRELGGEPLQVRADLSRQEDIDALVSATLERHGRVDYLVNNAAYTVGQALWAHVPELTREQFEKGMAINVTAPLMLITGFWETMREQGGGRIVNVTSGAADLQPLDVATRLEGSTLPDNGPVYGATKAALNRMANVIAHEGYPLGIAVINMEPGFVLTETMEQTFASQGVPEAGEQALPPSVPAAAILYLLTCDDPMQYSGQVLNGPELAAGVRTRDNRRPT